MGTHRNRSFKALLVSQFKLPTPTALLHFLPLKRPPLGGASGPWDFFKDLARMSLKFSPNHIYSQIEGSNRSPKIQAKVDLTHEPTFKQDLKTLKKHCENYLLPTDFQ